MAKALQFVGSSFLFLAGMAAGILLSIYGIAAFIAADSPLGKLNPIFRFPDIYYVVAAGAMVGLSVLLRKAAARIV
jgi:hypothetical protein